MTPEYSKETFPLSGVLEALGTEIRATRMRPFEAHYILMELLKKVLDRDSLVNLDYASTALTEAGCEPCPSTQEAAIVADNANGARLASTLLEEKGDISRRNYILDADLTSAGWSLSEYLSFRLLCIGVTNPRDVAGRGNGAFGLFEKRIKDEVDRLNIDFNLLNNPATSQVERKTAAQKVANAYSTVLHRAPQEPQPVNRLISLDTPLDSLSVGAERHFAEKMGVEKYAVAVLTETTFYDHTARLYNLPRLKQHWYMTYDKTPVLIAPTGSMLTIVKESLKSGLPFIGSC